MIVGRELLLRVNLACIIVLMLVATCVLVTGVYMLVAGISFLMQRSIVDGGWLLERKIRNRLFFSFIVQHIHELLQYFFILRIHTHIHLLVVFLQSFLLVSNLYECYLLLGLLVGGEIATSCLLVTQLPFPGCYLDFAASRSLSGVDLIFVTLSMQGLKRLVIYLIQLDLSFSLFTLGSRSKLMSRKYLAPQF